MKLIYWIRNVLTIALLASFVLLFTPSSAAGATSILKNGDFELGNTKFYSDFTYSHNDIYGEFTYDISPNPSHAHPNARSFFDHTLGTIMGRMMIVNGLATPDPETAVWRQTIDVLPGQTYEFICWHTLWAPGAAGLQILINGDDIGPMFMAGDGVVGVWTIFEGTWFSGTATEATISILNMTTSFSWNDFALDDLSFTLGQTALERNSWASIKSANF